MTTQNITDGSKKDALQKLLRSAEFKSTEKYKKLLCYLFEASSNNITIKESKIALDCLDKDSSFDPSIDSSVRVYLSKLRKKLEHYYLTEGSEDEIQLFIPKGQYYIQFRTAKSDKKGFKWKQYVIIAPIVIAFAIGGYFLGSTKLDTQENAIPPNDIIWHDILSGEKKTLIVLGDYYFFAYQYSKNRQSYIRDVEINSKNDLQEFIDTNKQFDGKIKPIYHTYLEESIPWCLSSILPSFIENSVEYELKLASEIQLNDLNTYNVIYIGPYKSLYLLSTIVSKLNFEYQVKQGASSLSIKDISSNETLSYNWFTNEQTKARNDYAMVINVSGPNDNSFLFFLSEHDFGNISTVKQFTNQNKIIEFEKNLTGEHFEALFEVKGIIRTDFESNLIMLNQIEDDFSIELTSNE